MMAAAVHRVKLRVETAPVEDMIRQALQAVDGLSDNLRAVLTALADLPADAVQEGDMVRFTVPTNTLTSQLGTIHSQLNSGLEDINLAQALVSAGLAAKVTRVEEGGGGG